LSKAGGELGQDVPVQIRRTFHANVLCLSGTYSLALRMRIVVQVWAERFTRRIGLVSGFGDR